MLAGNLINNSSYKKVRSISEGNFHSCYASNKAEKFKFGRLSQGLESCAQAQALKLRKEEKELLKLYQNIEKEKMKHEIEKKHNQFYLAETRQQQQQQQKKKTTQSTEQNTMKTTNIGENNGTMNIGKLSADKLQNVDLPPLSTRSKYNSIDRCHLTPKTNNKGNRTAHNKSRRCSLPAKLSPSNEVIPFYMQHGYSHYHDTQHDNHHYKNNNNKNRFNSANRSSITSSRASPNTLEQPCWKQRKSKLSRLKNRRNAIVVAAVNSEHTAFLNTISRNGERNRGVGFVGGGAEGCGGDNPALTSPTSPTSDISVVNDSLSVLNLGDVGISGEGGSTGNLTSRQAAVHYDVNNTDDDKLARHCFWDVSKRNNQGHTKSSNLNNTQQQQQQHGNSVLTPFERQELAKYQHRINMRQTTTTNASAMSPAPPLSSMGMDEMERRTRHHMGGGGGGSGIDEHHHPAGSNRGRRHTIAGTNKSMLSMLRHVLHKKLAKGESIKDLATDKSFEGLLDAIDDGRIYPAYHPDNTLSLEDFNALRKCKYLRVSQLNKESLTEAALTTLSTTEK